jgi:hypothetical protein
MPLLLNSPLAIPGALPSGDPGGHPGDEPLGIPQGTPQVTPQGTFRGTRWGTPMAPLEGYMHAPGRPPPAPGACIVLGGSPGVSPGLSPGSLRGVPIMVVFPGGSPELHSGGSRGFLGGNLKKGLPGPQRTMVLSSSFVLELQFAFPNLTLPDPARPAQTYEPTRPYPMSTQYLDKQWLVLVLVHATETFTHIIVS